MGPPGKSLTEPQLPNRPNGPQSPRRGLHMGFNDPQLRVGSLKGGRGHINLLIKLFFCDRTLLITDITASILIDLDHVNLYRFRISADRQITPSIKRRCCPVRGVGAGARLQEALLGGKRYSRLRTSLVVRRVL